MFPKINAAFCYHYCLLFLAPYLPVIGKGACPIGWDSSHRRASLHVPQCVGWVCGESPPLVADVTAEAAGRRETPGRGPSVAQQSGLSAEGRYAAPCDRGWTMQPPGSSV